MAIVPTLVDRVKIFTASSGTGPFALGPAVSAFRGSEALVDGTHYSYAVEQGSNYEAGTGEYILATNTLVRSPIISSNGGAPVAFAANAQVAFTALASDYRYGDGAQLRTDLAGNGGAALVGTAKGQTVQAAIDVTAARGPIGGSGLTQSSGLLLGRWSAGDGPIQQVTISTGLALDGSGNLTVAPPWASITGKPTTLSGYGITDGVSAGAVGSSGLTQATGKLLGRWSASTGAIQEVTVGTGLALDGSGNLTATGSASVTWGGITGTLSAQTDLQSALTARALTGAVGSSGLTQTTGKLLGRWSASTGAIQEVTIGTGLALDGSGNLTATATGAVWGGITGTLSAQTDLQTALNGKAATGAVGSSGLTMATARLLGRTTASTGAVESITVGTGLTLASGILSNDMAIEVGSATIVLQDSAGNSATMGANNVFRYVKIGPFIHLSGTLHWTATSALTNGSRLRLSGLPYAAVNIAQYRAPATIGAAASSSFSIGSDRIGGAVDFNSSLILLSRISTNNTDVNLVKSDIGNAGTVYGISIDYLAA